MTADGAVAADPADTPAVGRPRSVPKRREGSSAREEILDAAAQLFTEQGYAATSTRAIAESVGVKQASLYYHFASKEQILVDLLLATVQPSLDAAERLAALAAPPAVELWALAAYDVRLLCSGRWNLGALYLLPELRADRFSAFHGPRARLREAYGAVIDRGSNGGGFDVPDLETATRLAFGLVESVIVLRQEGAVQETDTVSTAVADGVLRLLGHPSRSLLRTRTEAATLLEDL